MFGYSERGLGMGDNSEINPSDVRLDSWKDIAAHLRREVRTVQLWEKNEGLPVHRHAHKKRGTVYAYKSELDAWWNGRRVALQGPAAAPDRRSWWSATVSLGVLVSCAIVWLAVARRAPPVGEPTVLPLTSDPGSEMGASFSPDGSQVAFAWKPEGKPDFDIYVKVVGSDDALQLTNTSDWDVSPAWSPDGRKIVFHRSGPQGECGIYAVSPLGGPASVFSELKGSGRQTPGCEKRCGCWSVNPKLSSAQFSWSPDGKWLAHAGVSLISPDTGEERRLTVPPDGELDVYPAFSPDGKSLAFVRTARAKHEIYVVDANGGEPRRIAAPGKLIFGLCWTADGEEIVYSSSDWAFSDAGLWRLSVSGGQPRRVAEARERAWLPAISAQGRRLAFTRRSNDINIWQVQPGAAATQPGGSRLIASTWVDAAPAFSPDGERIAFTSDRSGTQQLWICERDGSNARQLTFFPEPGAALGAWSPDGKQIAFNSPVNGNHDIYIVDVNGHTPWQLTPETTEEAAPSWSQDGQWVYFASTRTGRHEIWKIPVGGGASVQVTKHGGNRPVESPDGKYVFYEKGPAAAGREFAVWKTPVNGGEETLVADHGGSRWTLFPDGVYLYEREQGGELADRWFLKFYEFAGGRKRVLAPLEMPLIGQRPAVSPDRRTILYTHYIRRLTSATRT